MTQISDNCAKLNGGGIYTSDFGRLFVGENVLFENNHAFTGYTRDDTHDAIYALQIKCTVWTVPFLQGYNNYDISYTAGVLVTSAVTVSNSYAAVSGMGHYLFGESVKVDAGTRNGYTFSGWTITTGGITLSNSAVATFLMPVTDVALTANWTPIQYTITYVLGSGGINAAGNPLAYNVEGSFPITINSASRVNYEFLGWDVTYANGTVASFQNNYRILAGTTGNIVLTANWRAVDTDTATGGGGGSGSGGSGKPSPSVSVPSHSVPPTSEPEHSSPAPSPSSDGDNNGDGQGWSFGSVLLGSVLGVVAVAGVGGGLFLYFKRNKSKTP